MADKCDVDKQDECGKTELLKLCSNYNVDQAQQLYSKNPNVNIPDFDGTFPIHVLSKTDSDYVLTALRELINHDADTHATDKYGRTCLHISAYYNRREVVELLLEHDCDIEARDSEQNTAMHYAAMRTDSNGKFILELLHTKGAHIDKKNVYKKSPLHYASSRSVLQFFVSKLENLNAVDCDGKTILHYACSNFNSKDQVQMLVEEGADVNVCDSLGRNALIYGCKEGSVEIVKCLITKTNKMNLQDHLNNTALHYASQRIGGLQHAMCLIDANVSLNLQNVLGKTSLMIALEAQQYDVVEYLLNNHASVNIQDNIGRTPLHYAILYRTRLICYDDSLANSGEKRKIQSSGNIFQKIAEEGAVMNNKDYEGMTPFHYACMVQGNYDLIEILIRLNSNVMARDNYGRTPVYLAANCGDLKTVCYLLSVQNTFLFDEKCISSLFDTAVKNSNCSLLQYLLENQNILSSTDEDLLLTAAKYSSINILRMLCGTEPCFQGRDAKGQTVLHCLCKRQKEDMITYVLDKKCDVNATDQDGFTPLLVATENCCSLHILRELINKGADINISNSKCQLPIHFACKYLNSSTMTYFLQLYETLENTTPEFCILSKSDSHGKNILHYATENQDPTVLELLFKQGYDVNIPDVDGKTMLHYGGKQMTNGLADMFVSCGGDTNAVDSNRRSALHYAAEEGNVSFINWLVDNGCDINKADHRGFVPLLFAVVGNKVQAVKTILNSGANIESRDNSGKTVYHHAACGGTNEILKILLTKSMIFARDNDGRSPLDIACDNNNFEAIYYILQTKIDNIFIDFINKESGKGVLHSASEKGQRKIVYLLSLSGANLDLRTSQNRTALHLAVQNKHDSVVLLLLHHGADVNVRDGEGRTPLHIATQADDYRITSMLLRHNASKDIFDKFDELPIKYTNSQSVISLLQKDNGYDSEEFDATQEEPDFVGEKVEMCIYRNICLLEFTARHLVSGETVFVPTQLGNWTISYIKDHLPTENLKAMKFLVYNEQDVNNIISSCDGLVKYAYLALIRGLGNLFTIDARNCLDLFSEVAKVEEKYSLPSSTRDEVIQQLMKDCKDFHKMFVVHTNTTNMTSSTASNRRKNEIDNEYQKQKWKIRECTSTRAICSSHDDVNCQTSLQNKLTLLEFLDNELTPHGYIKENTVLTRTGNKIHEYIKERKWHEIDAYLRKQNSLDVKNKSGWTPLHLSILYGLDEYVLLLLKNNADVNILTKDVTPIPLFFSNGKRSDRNYFMTISPLLLATLLDRQNIARLLAQENVSENDLEMCLELSFGEQIETEILEGLCRRMSRKFSNISLQVYPGYRQITPLKRTLLGLSSDIFQTTKQKFSSLDLLIRNPMFYDENEDIENDNESDVSPYDCEMLKGVIAKYSSRLWQCHSLLNVITGASVVRSNVEDKTRLCIVLYSSIKDFIPLHERSFPSKLKMDDVDYGVIIREGRAVLGPMDPQIKCSIPFNTTMRTGSSVGRLGGESGTMGPVVNIGENGIGFISCAHIFFDKEIRGNRKLHYDETTTKLDEPIYVVQPTDEEIYKARQNYDFEKSFLEQTTNEQKNNENSSQEPEIFSNSNLRVCGKVVKAVFDPERDPSIDAALIHITRTERCPKDGSFTAVSLRNLANAGFKSPPVFFTGKTLKHIPNNTFGGQGVVSGEVLKGGAEVVKVGASSEITRGAVAFEGLQAKLTTDQKLSFYCCKSYSEIFHCCHPRIEFIMKGQYQIRSSKHSQFFILGDSGAGVFTVDRNKNNELTCVGIAVGVLPDGDTIVTPIEPVLSALGNVQLKQFASSTKRTHDHVYLRKDTQEDTSPTKRLKQ